MSEVIDQVNAIIAEQREWLRVAFENHMDRVARMIVQMRDDDERRRAEEEAAEPEKPPVVYEYQWVTDHDGLQGAAADGWRVVHVESALGEDAEYFMMREVTA